MSTKKTSSKVSEPQKKLTERIKNAQKPQALKIIPSSEPEPTVAHPDVAPWEDIPEQDQKQEIQTVNNLPCLAMQGTPSSTDSKSLNTPVSASKKVSFKDILTSAAPKQTSSFKFVNK